ncbi:hypothetical protein PVK06_034158 [Gossypium arboreum]|uniref:Reverse transcriptase domain-containing protein n=1 Tax=Gossypium arboreum TaxID=29729 RepID=A0ABR0NFI1_GOSAR|nr:hypothetical protein PVK06_034158 [Gossypium arboreum]
MLKLAGIFVVLRRARMTKGLITYFFADDALFFIKNKKKEINTVVNILRQFESVSEQKIYLSKSMVWFCLKTPGNQRQFFGDMLGMRVVENLDHYLGLPLFVGK